MSDMKNHRWDALLKRIPEGQDLKIVEVGVWKADTSTRIMQARPRVWMGLVDSWSWTPPDSSYHKGSLKMSKMSQAEMDVVMDLALSRLRPYSKQCQVYNMSSEEASSYFESKSLYMAFLDADHSFEGLSLDLFNWVPKIMSGGYICGHDYAHPKQGQVKEAVEAFFNDEQLSRLELDSNLTWFIRL